MAKTPLSDEVKRENFLARKLFGNSGPRYRKRLQNFRNRAMQYDRDDPAYLPPEMYDDLPMLQVARNAEKIKRTPIQEILRKKTILVDTPDVKNHFSAKAFLDRYKQAILALLQSNESEYQKRRLRAMMRNLDQKYFNGDDAPLPAHVAANDRRRAEYNAAQAAAEIRIPFEERERARIDRAQAKEVANIHKKYSKKSMSKKNRRRRK